MIRLREEYDASLAEKAMEASSYPTDKQQHEVFCDMCGEVFFVDELTGEKVRRALSEGFDNPFVCEDCGDAGDAAYYER